MWKFQFLLAMSIIVSSTTAHASIIFNTTGTWAADGGTITITEDITFLGKVTGEANLLVFDEIAEVQVNTKRVSDLAQQMTYTPGSVNIFGYYGDKSSSLSNTPGMTALDGAINHAPSQVTAGVTTILSAGIFSFGANAGFTNPIYVDGFTFEGFAYLLDFQGGPALTELAAVSSIPEPSSIAMWSALGIIGLAVARRKRKLTRAA